MLQNLSLDQKILIFRISISILIGGVNLLTTLGGKLLKESNVFGYTYFHTICCGILIAKGLGDIFFNKYINSEVAATLFSVGFLLLFLAKVFTDESPYAYNQVSLRDQMMNEDDDEDLGIEISYIKSSNGFEDDDDEENASERPKKIKEADFERAIQQAAMKNAREQKISFIWFLSVAFAMFWNELSIGFLLGSSEHATFNTFMKIILDGLLQSMAFGVLCEESIVTSSGFLMSVFAFISAKPIGVAIGHIMILEEAKVLQINAFITLLTSGLYLAFVVFYMIPMNESLSENNLESNHALITTPRSQNKVSGIRVSSFILGYCITLLLNFLPL